MVPQFGEQIPGRARRVISRYGRRIINNAAPTPPTAALTPPPPPFVFITLPFPPAVDLEAERRSGLFEHWTQHWTQTQPAPERTFDIRRVERWEREERVRELARYHVRQTPLFKFL